MQVQAINNNNYNRPNFKANLLLSGETLESCLEKNNISSKQVKMIQVRGVQNASSTDK